MIKKPLILDIKGNSLDDGPGIRSVVFFKGCPLSCTWCQNPESQSIKPELFYDREKCIGCRTCMEICPQSAISPDPPFLLDRILCNGCFLCVENCPSQALRPAGEKMRADEIVNKVIQYKPFFDSSGGGVSLSGGEATLYMDFCGALLNRFKEENIHTLVETCGWFDMARFERAILPWVDMVYMDLKIMDPHDHKKFCGRSNEKIFNNFIQLNQWAKKGKINLLPRTPLIPGITDTQANIRDLIGFYTAHNIKKASLLGNNPTWINKCEQLGLEARPASGSKLDEFYDLNQLKTIKSAFKEKGIEIVSS